jgi:teichoic acid transport system permease protein
LKEQYDHFYLIRRLSIFEIKSKNRNNLLGSSWEVLNLIIQLVIYWFVFQNVRKHETIVLSDGTEVPFFFWLTAGFILWMFFHKSTIDGSNSIYTRIKILSKMNFPMSVVPSYVIFSYFYIHLVMVGITVLLFSIGGFHVNVHYLQFLYFMPATLFFLFSLALITSTLSTIVRDVHMLLNAVMRMLLYLSPILWEIGSLPDPIGTIAKLNPLYYLIEGYRSAFFGTEWYFITHWEYSLYFWGVTMVLFTIGATVHMKFRRHFVDYL